MTTKSVINIAIVTDSQTAAQITKERALGDRKDSYNSAMVIERLANYLQGVASGVFPGKVFMHQDQGDGTAATGTLAFTQASISDGDTFKVGDTTFTAKTSPSTVPSKGEFAFLTSDTVTGAAAAAAINAHPALKGMGTGANSNGTVTFTMADKGIHGNFLQLVGSTGIVATSPTNGAKGTAQTPLRVNRRGL